METGFVKFVTSARPLSVVAQHRSPPGVVTSAERTRPRLEVLAEMDDEDLAIRMGRDLPYMLTIVQAGHVVGVGRTTAHKLAR